MQHRVGCGCGWYYETADARIDTSTFGDNYCPVDNREKILPVSLHRATLGVMTRSHPNDRHDTYSFLLDVSDFLRSLDGMSDWSDRITAIADENFDPSVDGDK